MRLPRDLSGTDLIKALRRLGYEPTRQTGSHIRLTTHDPAEHHLTVPRHDPLRVGTLAAILDSVAAHRKSTREQVLEELFGKSA